MKVLVTGATGFIGSWLTNHLTKHSGIDSVRVLHRKNSDLSQIEHLSFEHCIGDVLDKNSLLKATKSVDAVFHLAGIVAYKKSERQRMQEVNVNGTQNVVDACVENNVKRLVHISSVVAVGASFTPNSLNENSPYNLEHLDLGYFQTKRAAEKIVHNAVLDNKLDGVILNPSTVYGPGDARKGSRKTQLSVAKGKFPFYTSGGVNVVGIEDVCQGIISAWQTGQCGERYILAGENLLIKDLLTLIAKEAGVPPPFIPLPKPLTRAIGIVGDQLEKYGLKPPLTSETAWTSSLYHWFDATKAKSKLNFNPAPAQQAIAKSVEWMKNHGLLN